jgi:hypothetical protein
LLLDYDEIKNVSNLSLFFCIRFTCWIIFENDLENVSHKLNVTILSQASRSYQADIVKDARVYPKVSALSR